MPTARRARRTALWGIIAAVFLVGTGVGSVLPILPFYGCARPAGMPGCDRSWR
ncbi:MAG TPA: hypothetical protein VN912_01775 [Candidatus Angelobacter sp.]|nr:hypothetical protein [Candidatus Angelobacter sp.]